MKDAFIEWLEETVYANMEIAYEELTPNKFEKLKAWATTNDFKILHLENKAAIVLKKQGIKK
jgi:hypothetical protein